MNVIKKTFGFIKKRKKWVISIIIVLAILAFIFRPKPPVPPETTTVKQTNLVQTVSVSGTTDAATSVNLTFPVSGKIVYIGAKEGDSVKKYQTIAALDQRTLVANIQNAVKSQQNSQIQFDIVNDFNGDRPLYDTGLNAAALRQLQTALNTLDQTQIAVTIQKLAQEQAILYSPIDGILTHADIQVPGVVATTQTTYTVADPTSMIFKMDVDEADIAKVKVGQLVKIVLDAYPNDTITSPVDKIDFASHETTNGGNAYTVQVKLASDSAHTYRIGINGNADITTAEKDNVLTIPISCIEDDNIIYVQVPKGYEKRHVVLGLENDISVEVISGLKEGDKVVLDPTKVPATEVIK